MALRNENQVSKRQSRSNNRSQRRRGKRRAPISSRSRQVRPLLSEASLMSLFMAAIAYLAVPGRRSDLLRLRLIQFRKESEHGLLPLETTLLAIRGSQIGIDCRVPGTEPPSCFQMGNCVVHPIVQ